MMQKLLTISEASNMLGLTKSYIYNLVWKRQIPHLKYGARLIRFRESELEEWMNERTVEIKTDRQLKEEATSYVMNH